MFNKIAYVKNTLIEEIKFNPLLRAGIQREIYLQIYLRSVCWKLRCEVI